MTRTAHARRPIALGGAALLLLSALVVAPSAGAHPGPHNGKVDAPGIGVLLSPGTPDEQFLQGFQYAGTPGVADQEAPFSFVGNGCTPEGYAGADVEGKIALADESATGVCPPTTFFQRVAYAEQAGAIGLVIIPAKGTEPTTNGTAVQGGIPALEVFRTPEILAALESTQAGEDVVARLTDTRAPIPSSGPAPCEAGVARSDDGVDAEGEALPGAAFECSGIDLLGFVAEEDFDSAGVSDIWGWTDANGDEYVIMGKTNGVAFFDVTDPTNPIVLGELPNPSPQPQTWHDIKVFKDHAFIVSESETHGMTVFDLTRLRDLGASDELRQFTADATYELTSAAHNLEINTETGFAYIVGGNAGLVAPDHCMSGLHMVDINDPTNPTFAGCYLAEGGPGTAARVVGEPVTEVSPAAYVHDTSCVIYTGPDVEHQGKEVCFNSAEESVVIADVSNKTMPVTVGSTAYDDVAYTHQGSLTADQRYLLVNDELDEQTFGHNTRTVIVDVSDLDNPVLHHIHEHETAAIDHNNYVHEGFVYQSNYAAGLRVLDVSEVADKKLTEVAYFDTYPAHTDATFDGTWSNYPFFESGTVAVSGRDEGLFLLKVRDEVLNRGEGTEEPALQISCDNCPVDIRAGESGTATLVVIGAGDGAELTVSNVPEGWTVTPNPQDVTADGDVDVTVQVPKPAKAGVYTLTATVARGTASANEQIEVEVRKGRPSDRGPRS
jgi:choice-of-anchor B domain-containing protein